MEDLEIVSISSHTVWRAKIDGKRCIIKRPRMALDALSPFWRMLRSVFGVDFDTQRRDVFALAERLAQNPHIPPARPVFAGEDFVVMEEMDGTAWEPDAFPQSEGVLRRLGQYIGWLHSKRMDTFGDRREAGTFAALLLAAMKEIIDRDWQGDGDVLGYWEGLSAQDWQVISFAPVMLDISANQFVFSPDFQDIRAVVDLDAYVVGPPEWELTVLEMCMADGAAFRAGYETYGPLPYIARWRGLYRFAMYLCDPWEKAPLADFMEQPVRW